VRGTLRAHDLFLAHRREAEARRRAHERDALALGLFADGLDGLLVAALELALDLLQARAVLVGLEGAGDAGAQVLDEAAMSCLKRSALPAGA